MSRYARELDLRELNAHTQGILLTPPGSDVLDVGTADGHPVVAGLTARGCRVWGVEIDEEAAAEAAPCASRWWSATSSSSTWPRRSATSASTSCCASTCSSTWSSRSTRCAGSRTCSPRAASWSPRSRTSRTRRPLQLLGGAFTYTDTGLLDRTHVRFFDRTEVTALFDDAGMTVLERLEVRREPHETEIPIDLDAVPAETLAQVTADPDARVFQWMLVAKRHVDGAEVDTTGLPTALLGEVTRLERAGRESAEHVGWLEQQLRVKTTESERVASWTAPCASALASWSRRTRRCGLHVRTSR
jgi:hypothetical protein